VRQPHHATEPAAAVRVPHLDEPDPRDAAQQFPCRLRKPQPSAQMARVMPGDGPVHGACREASPLRGKEAMQVQHQGYRCSGPEQFRVFTGKSQGARGACRHDRVRPDGRQQRGVLRRQFPGGLPVSQGQQGPSAALQPVRNDYLVADPAEDTDRGLPEAGLLVIYRAALKKNDPAFSFAFLRIGRCLNYAPGTRLLWPSPD